MSNKTAITLGREIEEGLENMMQSAEIMAEEAGMCQLHAVESRMDRVHAVLKTTLHGLKIQLAKMEAREKEPAA